MSIAKTFRFMIRFRELSGRVLDLRPRGCGFQPYQHHCVVVLEQNTHPSLALVQPRKTRPCLIERLMMGRKESNQMIRLCTCFPRLFHVTFIHCLSSNIVAKCLLVAIN